MGRIELASGVSLSRRDFGKAALGLGAAFIAANVAHEDFLDQKPTDYPEGFFDQDLVIPTTDEVLEILNTQREYFDIEFGTNEPEGILLQGHTVVPIPGRTIEMTFKGIYSSTPSETVIRVRANGQEPRLATLIVSPDPEDTTILFDAFDTEDVYVEVEKLSEGPVSLDKDQFDGKIKFSQIVEDCIEQDIIDSTSGVLPRNDRWNSLRFEAPYKRYAVVYYLRNGDRIDLQRLEMLCEVGGTKPGPLYEGTRVYFQGKKGPGRTIDGEWDIELVKKPDGTFARIPRIQEKDHATGYYRGIYYKGRRPVSRIKTFNNNFEPVIDEDTKEEVPPPMEVHPQLAEGFFLYKPNIISHEQFEYMQNRPNRFTQWRSLEQLIELGRLKSLRENIIVDFASYHQDVQALLDAA